MTNPRIFLLLICLAFSANIIQAQEKKPDWRKLHYLSEEEMQIEFDFKRNFNETDPPLGPVRNVAEYDQMQSVLIRYPFGIPMTLIKEMAENCEVVTLVANESQKQSVITQYTNNDVNLDNCSFLIIPTDSYWTRDYGPWFVFDGDNKPGIVDFPYNRPRPNDNNVPVEVANYLNIDLYGMILETAGGNYMTDGLGRSSSTELIYEENPQLSEYDVDSILEYYLGIQDYYVIDDPLDDYIKHIDCWGKFLSPGKVLIGEVPETDYRYEDFEDAANFFENEICAWGVPYEVYRVYTPGAPQPTPYTNSLILNDHVFVPTTGNQWDDEAIQAYEDAMPGYTIHSIYHSNWVNTDALHCRTKGIADLGMLYIEHMPLLGSLEPDDNFEFVANITAASEAALFPDSVLVYYSINGGDYNVSTMEPERGTNWVANISGLEIGDEVDYYLFAADESGRRSFHPYIGQADPHEFTVQIDELFLTPDTLLFLSYDEMLDGKELDIINISNNEIEIDYITPGWDEWGSDFNWMVDNMPDLPYMLGINDTLTLNIILGIVTMELDGELLVDTLFIETADNSYLSLVMVDSDLVGTDEYQTEKDIKVYPNPFTDQLNFNFSLSGNQKVQLTVYDLSGRIIFEQEATLGDGFQTINWKASSDLTPGYYIYRLQTADQTKSGKIILNR